jgi:hypothetical protein
LEHEKDRQSTEGYFDFEIPTRIFTGVQYCISEWMSIYGEARLVTSVFRLAFDGDLKLHAGYGFVIFLPRQKK